MIENAAQRLWITDLSRKPQGSLGEFNRTRNEHAAAGKNNSGREQRFTIDALEFEIHVVENFFEPCLDDLGYMVTRNFVILLRIEF